MINILIVEDDRSLSDGIILTLKEDNRQFYQSYDIDSARIEFKNKNFNLIILDINLPDGNGFDFCREIRMSSQIPIIFLTANDTEIDMVSGLEIGGDDYITKPFSLAILRARVNALLRRENNHSDNKYIIDDFIFDFESLFFSKNDIAVELSNTEQKLLLALLKNKGITMSREKLSASIWYDGLDYVDENALSVAIRRLRNKLEDNPSKPKYIITIFGIGYTWAVKN